LWAGQLRADPTVQNFDGGGTPYALTGFGGDPADDTQKGPTGKCLRLTQATNSGLNTCAFDRTQTGPVGHVVADFDFRIGDSTDGRSHGADGIGFVLINTTNLDANGNSRYGTMSGTDPSITEEAQLQASLGIGLDTWDNDLPGVIDPNDNHISLFYSDNPQRDSNGGNGISESVGNVGILYAVSLTPFNYHLHRKMLPDNDPFDHFHMTLDVATGGANVTVTITPNGQAAFTPINNLFIPNFAPYEMRVAFGARTGGENENHDIDNINVTFAPP
jgi:hypothetical protein